MLPVGLLLAPAFAGAIYLPGDSSYGDRFAVLSLSVWVLCLPAAVLPQLRQVLWLWIPAVALSPAYLFYSLAFKSVPGDALVAAVLHTDWRLSLSALKAFGLPIAVGAALGVLGVITICRLPRGWRMSALRRQVLLAGLLAYACLGLWGRLIEIGRASMAPLFDWQTAASVYPVNVVLSVQRVLVQAAREVRYVSIGARAADPSPLVVVFVIGESVRADHLSINGYGRNTTPLLLSRRSEWLSYSDTASSAHWTGRAVPNLVERRVAGGKASLVRSFREAGYHTNWLSNQEPGPYSAAAHLSHHATTSADFHLRSDRALLPLLHSQLRQGGARQFVVLHMIGSHFPYEERYSPEFKRFTPALDSASFAEHPGPGLKRESINSYDNTLLELDSFLDRVRDELAALQIPAILIFTSDHGENLFDDERQRFLHALPTPARVDLMVPLLFWANGAYLERNVEAWQALARHARLPVAHRDIFPTLLDLARIEASGVDLVGASLARPGFLPGPRLSDDLNGPHWKLEELR